MPTYITNTATVLSIFPVEMEKQCIHNGLITYRHPVAPRDEILVRTYNPERLSTTSMVPHGTPDYTDETRPCEANKGYMLVRVCDTFVWTRDFTQDSEVYIPHPIPAVMIARDLVTHWASDSLKGDGGSGPGMMVIQGDEPTVAELQTLRDSQTRYFRTLINDGQTLYSKSQVKDISDLHRSGASWLGANNLPWLAKIEQVDLKKCVACGNDIRAAALRCEKCNVDLPDFYRKYQIEVDPLTDPAVHALFSRLPSKSKVA